MEQVNRDAETSAEAIQPAVPQIASRVRPFNSEEKKTVVEKKKEKKEKDEKEKKESSKTGAMETHRWDPRTLY